MLLKNKDLRALNIMPLSSSEIMVGFSEKINAFSGRFSLMNRGWIKFLNPFIPNVLFLYTLKT